MSREMKSQSSDFENEDFTEPKINRKYFWKLFLFLNPLRIYVWVVLNILLLYFPTAGRLNLAHKANSSDLQGWDISVNLAAG